MATSIVTGLLRSMEKGERLSKIVACVRSETSAERIRHQFRAHNDFLQVEVRGNVRVAASSDLIMLAHNPSQVQTVLGEPGMMNALRRKGIISILAGVEAKQLRKTLGETRTDEEFDIIRALPNVGALVGECMTLICDPRDVSPQLIENTKWLFGKIGRVIEVDGPAFDAGTVMTGAGYALSAVAIEGIVDGGVQQGLPRNTAMEITLQCLKGLIRMLENGEHPTLVRESISTPGSATITGYLELERNGVRHSFADAVRRATDHTRTLGEKQDAV